ncbi:hypothetical protein [Tepidibacillus marianensis]|uniref:hypothetical protein n=1 Tax=Tepidibacillus marianensis TaxID=3131995 RepID=UPI0030CB27DA
MKEAMWKVDSGGAFSFSDATDPNQLVLFGNEPNYDYLKQLILNKFRGKQTSIDQIEEFVLLHTPFLSTHIRKPILVPLEKDYKLSIISSPRKKKNTYPSSTILEIH